MTFKPLIVVAVIMILMSCKSDYRKKVETELAKNIRQDSLFMGLRFGMTPRQFFAHAWELNQSGLVTQGYSGTKVLYIMEGFNKKYEVNFYPNFIDNRIAGLPVEYSYAVYAPWNPSFSVDTLFKEVAIMYKESHGDDFLSVPDPQGGTALVRVDGNRRLSIYKNIVKNNVTVLYKDLSVPTDKTN